MSKTITTTTNFSMTVLQWDATRQRASFWQKRLSRLNQDYIFLEGEEKIQRNCFLLEGEEKVEKKQTKTTTTQQQQKFIQCASRQLISKSHLMCERVELWFSRQVINFALALS